MMRKFKSLPAAERQTSTQPPALKPVPIDLIGLKPIYFKDMTANMEYIYEGFVIKLTVIEDAITGAPSVSVIAEDDHGHAQRIFVYNFKQDKETQNFLGFGCKISIVNPYYRIPEDRIPAIRVDDSSHLPSCPPPGNGKMPLLWKAKQHIAL
jgi:hypothetical protein